MAPSSFLSLYDLNTTLASSSPRVSLRMRSSRSHLYCADVCLSTIEGLLETDLCYKVTAPPVSTKDVFTL